jgi:hypothetical protein
LSDEKRIYVVVAETVQQQVTGRSTTQVCGRIAAQCAHVVSKMQVARYLDAKDYDTQDGQLIPCTTIVLAARDSAEMMHIFGLIQKHTKVAFAHFHDVNPEVYGHDGKVLTAICTEPTTAESMVGITDYLPLWIHGRNVAGI